MLCVRCHTPNPDTSRFCCECGESFGSDPSGHGPSHPHPGQEAPTLAGSRPSDSMAATTVGGIGTSPGLHLGILPRGFILGDRYEIQEPLGMGGMGMVYRARDRQLDVPVALKLIRGEYADNERILERFKKEITIARQVTHRNVARIYDLGEAEGLRYISMEYIQGQDLSHLVEKNGPMSVEQTISVLRQTCAALKEAHSVGVVHRDLKPHNIILDATGRAHVMDFGIAMSVDSRGMTRTGALIGTPEYMSPEQAEGRKLDHRTDIYSLGITLYEVLSGDAPFKGDTTWEVIKKQIEQRPHSIRRTRPDLPEWLDTLILKCLEKDPALRYQSVGEILNDIDRQKAHLSARHYLPSRRALGLAGTALILVAAAVGITMLLRPKVPVAGTGGRRSVAILRFENQTGRSDLDWLRTGLADNLTTDLAESKYFRVLSRERLSQIFHELGLSDETRMDSDTLKRIGEFGAVEVVLTGSFLSEGDQIRVNLTMQDPATGEILETHKLKGRESEVLGIIDKLTLATKEMFKLAPERLAGDADLKIASARTSSVESASLYQKGVDLLYQGKNLDAIGPLQDAVAADPEFSMAHARLAEAHMRTGHDREAAEASREAMNRMLAQAEKLPQTDRTFIRALHGRISNQPEDSIRAYEEMLKSDPDDPFVAFSLGEVFEETGDFAAAERHYLEAIQHDSKNPVLRLTLGRVRVKANDYEEALPDLQEALELSTQLGNEEGRSNALNVMAFANESLGRFDEALDYYGRSEAIKRRIGDKSGLAKTLGNKAGLLQMRGRIAEALVITEEALALFKEIGDTDGTAVALTALGSLMEDSGNIEEFVRYNGECLNLGRTLKDRLRQVRCLLGLGRGQLALGSFAQAKESIAEGERISREIDNEEGIAEFLSERARVDYLRGELKQAGEGQGRAIQLWRNAARDDGIAEAQYRLAEIQDALGQYAGARRSIESALKTYKELGDRVNEARVALVLAKLNLSIGDEVGALSVLSQVQSSLTSLDNPILHSESALLRTRALVKRGDAVAAGIAAEQSCQAAGRTRAVTPAIQCGLAKSLVAAPEDAVAQALAASTRAADYALPILQAEASLALAMAYQRDGKPNQAAGAARQALEAAHKMNLPNVELGAAPILATSLWDAGKRQAAVSTLQVLFKKLDTIEASLDPETLKSFQSRDETRAAARMLGDYLKLLGREAEASSYLARSSS